MLTPRDIEIIQAAIGCFLNEGCLSIDGDFSEEEVCAVSKKLNEEVI